MEGLDLSVLTQETLAKAAQIIAKDFGDPSLQKATIDQALGLTGYNLETPAKLMEVLLSPFRSSIPRVTVLGNSINWKAITGVTPTASPWVGEATKAQLFTLSKTDYTVAYKTLARGADVTWEAVQDGKNFEDVRARAEALLLLQYLKEEELAILGGNVTALSGEGSGKGPAPTVSASDTGGSLAAATYYVDVCALTLEGMSRVSRIYRVPATYLVNTSTVANIPTIDKTVGITLPEDTQGSGVVGSSAGSLTITWTAVPGAAGYAVFMDDSSTTKLQCVITQCKLIVTAMDLTGAGTVVPVSDTTANTTAYEGIIAQLTKSGSGAYVKAVNGQLSAAVGRQIPEISAAITDGYDRTKTQPSRLLMSWVEHTTIDNLIAATTGDRIRINVQMAPGGPKMEMITTYPSPIDGKHIPIEQNPNLPGGMIIGLIDNVPYPNSNVPAAWRMAMGAPIGRLDYAFTSPKHEFEIRSRGALQGYAPAFQFVMHDIHAKEPAS